MEFEHVGRHCSHVGCNQRDFLPFKCDGCNHQFCLEHRSRPAHGCVGHSVTSVACPICDATIKYREGLDDVNELFEQHYASGCTRSQPPPRATARCGAGGCHTVLGPSNSLRCSRCGTVTCIAHRASHDCEAKQAQARAASRTAGTRTVASAPSVQRQRQQQQARPPQPQPRRRSNPADDVRATAARRMRGSSGAAAAPPTDDGLHCPHCGAGFGDPVELVTHVEAAHAHATAAAPAPSAPAGALPGGGGGGGGEVCPQCGVVAPDAVALVAHVESAHAGGPRRASEGGGGGDKCCIA
mmetsp:Transcript_10397/g.35363  ORF Transcript_10397/g.35363 Transcript_10397/m.35363 type:complete len:298 (-) Transcript_10397:7-900(-)